MIKKHSFFRSLSGGLMLALFCALLCALAAYLCCNELGESLVNKYYMSDEAIVARRTDLYNELRDYVEQNDISSMDIPKIGEWTMGKQYVTVAIRRDDQLVNADQQGATTTKIKNGLDPTFYDVSGGTLYFMRFSDGVFLINISENTQTREFFLCKILSVIIACLIIVLIMLIYNHRLITRISALARKAQAIGQGDLNSEITVKGHDELSQLGSEMDDMRRSIVQRIDSEHRAWQANSSLITAISHDLRTPMTAIIGYLELMKSEKIDEAQRARFTETACMKAMELKDLTDELFRYFLVFSDEEVKLQMEDYNASILLDQLIGEKTFELREYGFDVRGLRLPQQCTIRVDVMQLKRVFDNLFSNVKKYADPSRPVVVLAEVQDGRYLSVCISNSKDRRRTQVESSKIGLQTCEKIMNLLGGSFNTSNDRDHFMAEVILPITSIGS